ncbi:MAG: hypothetical protein AAGJ80_16150, partial [Cyanobacteria bacterium J06553_1]
AGARDTTHSLTNQPLQGLSHRQDPPAAIILALAWAWIGSTHSSTKSHPHRHHGYKPQPLQGLL